MTSIPAVICRNYGNNFKRRYLRDKRLFLDFWLHFLNVHQISSIFKKKMNLLLELFRNYWLWKTWLLNRLKSLASEHHSPMNLFNGFQTLLKSAWHNHYPLFSWIRGNLSCKMSAYVWTEMLSLFVNTLTADDKYSRVDMQNSSQQFQTLLSLKQNTFCRFSVTFLTCA